MACDMGGRRYLSVKLRISMGSSSKVSGTLDSSLSSSSCSSSFFANTSPSVFSSSSGTMAAFNGSSMSDACGPCSVLARLRESGLLGAESSRVKEREGCRFLGRPVMLLLLQDVEWKSKSVVCLHRESDAAGKLGERSSCVHVMRLRTALPRVPEIVLVHLRGGYNMCKVSGGLSVNGRRQRVAFGVDVGTRG